MRAKNKKVEGVGINDADYEVVSTCKETGKRKFCPYYLTWRNMLKRCYNKKYQQTQPTYMVCEISEEWILFSTFKCWMERQEWKGNQLDKDLLGDGKLYSEENCTFIPQGLNKLITNFSRTGRSLPEGVTYDKNRDKYMAQVGAGDSSKAIKRRFESADEADQFYRFKKMELILEASTQYVGKIRRALILKAYTFVEENYMSFDQWCMEYEVTF